MNVDRFWLGFVAGMLLAAIIIEVCKWGDRHLIFIR